MIFYYETFTNQMNLFIDNSIVLLYSAAVMHAVPDTRLISLTYLFTYLQDDAVEHSYLHTAIVPRLHVWSLRVRILHHLRLRSTGKPRRRKS